MSVNVACPSQRTRLKRRNHENTFCGAPVPPPPGWQLNILGCPYIQPTSWVCHSSVVLTCLFLVAHAPLTPPTLLVYPSCYRQHSPGLPSTNNHIMSISTACSTSAFSKGKARPAWSRMQSTTRSRDLGSSAVSNYSLGDWQLPLNFDHTKSTAEIYRSPAPVNDVSQFQRVRATRDHAYHGFYTRERQLFQGDFARDAAGESVLCLAS